MCTCFCVTEYVQLLACVCVAASSMNIPERVNDSAKPFILAVPCEGESAKSGGMCGAEGRRSINISAGGSPGVEECASGTLGTLTICEGLERLLSSRPWPRRGAASLARAASSVPGNFLGRGMGATRRERRPQAVRRRPPGGGAARRNFGGSWKTRISSDSLTYWFLFPCLLFFNLRPFPALPLRFFPILGKKRECFQRLLKCHTTLSFSLFSPHRIGNCCIFPDCPMRGHTSHTRNTIYV